MTDLTQPVETASTAPQPQTKPEPHLRLPPSPEQLNIASIGHAWRYANELKAWQCKECDTHFSNHHHNESWLQKMIALANGLNWNDLTFNQRQTFKRIAKTWINDQRRLS